MLQMALFCSFLWPSSIPVHVYTHHIFFIHSSVGGHLCCCHVCRILKCSLRQLCYSKRAQYQCQLGILSPSHTVIHYINTYACTWPIYFPAGSDSKASVHNAGDLGSSPGLGRSLEKEMAIYSSTTAWKIPWTEETGRLQSMGSLRVRHD